MYQIPVSPTYTPDGNLPLTRRHSIIKQTGFGTNLDPESERTDSTTSEFPIATVSDFVAFRLATHLMKQCGWTTYIEPKDCLSTPSKQPSVALRSRSGSWHCSDGVIRNRRRKNEMQSCGQGNFPVHFDVDRALQFSWHYPKQWYVSP